MLLANRLTVQLGIVLILAAVLCIGCFGEQASREAAGAPGGTAVPPPADRLETVLERYQQGWHDRDPVKIMNTFAPEAADLPGRAFYDEVFSQATAVEVTLTVMEREVLEPDTRVKITARENRDVVFSNGDTAAATVSVVMELRYAEDGWKISELMEGA